jgi:hypothetical protein
LLAFLSDANDAITAILAVAIAAILRATWTLQQRISRLEAMDEYRERLLSLDRADEPSQEEDTDGSLDL